MVWICDGDRIYPNFYMTVEWIDNSSLSLIAKHLRLSIDQIRKKKRKKNTSLIYSHFQFFSFFHGYWCENVNQRKNIEENKQKLEKKTTKTEDKKSSSELLMGNRAYDIDITMFCHLSLLPLTNWFWSHKLYTPITFYSIRLCSVYVHI